MTKPNSPSAFPRSDFVLPSSLGIRHSSFHRQNHPDRGALANLTLCFHPATMELRNMFHNRQSQTGTSQFATASFVSTIKALENSRQMLLADPKSIIGHAQYDVGAAPRRS